MTYTCADCNAPISYQRHKNSGKCKKCQSKIATRKHRRQKIVGGFYTEICPKTLAWAGGRIYDSIEIRKALKDEIFRIGATVEFWAPTMRNGKGVFLVVVDGGEKGLVLAEPVK